MASDHGSQDLIDQLHICETRILVAPNMNEPNSQAKALLQQAKKETNRIWTETIWARNASDKESNIVRKARRISNLEESLWFNMIEID